MSFVKTILVPLDGAAENERAAPLAAALARELGAEVLLVAVSSLVADVRRDLERVMWCSGFEGRIEVVDSQDVVASLARVAEESPETAICMTTHGRGRVARPFLGSTAERLLREVSLPFVLVGPRCRTDWPSAARRMLVAVDPAHDPGALLGLAGAWARGLGLQPWLTAILSPHDRESARAAADRLDVAVGRLGADGPPMRACTAWSADVPGEILHLADVISASLIAVGTHAHEHAGTHALGRVAMEVVHRASCPVLTVRPAAEHPGGDPHGA
jgi:nucleotide-binding universal stress UspA family protein